MATLNRYNPVKPSKYDPISTEETPLKVGVAQQPYSTISYPGKTEVEKPSAFSVAAPEQVSAPSMQNTGTTPVVMPEKPKVKQPLSDGFENIDKYFPKSSQAPYKTSALAEQKLKEITPIPRNLVGKAKEEFIRGQEGIKIDTDMYNAMMGNDENAYIDVRKRADKLANLRKKDPLAYDSFIQESLGTVTGMVPGMLTGNVQGKIAGIGAGALAIIAGQLGPQAATPEEVITVPTAYKTGEMLGGMQYWYRQGAGSMYGEMRNEGVNHDTSKIIASIAGVPYAAIEFSQVDKIIPGLSKLAKAEVGSLAKKSIASMVKKYGVNWVTEVGEEGIQEFITGMSIEISKWMDDKVEGNTLATALWEVAKRSLETMRDSAIPMLLLTAPGAVAEGTGAYGKIGKDVRGFMEKPKVGLGIEDVSKPQQTITNKNIAQAQTGQPISIKGYAGTVEDGKDSGFRSQDKGIAQQYSLERGGEVAEYQDTLNNPYVAENQTVYIKELADSGNQQAQEIFNEYAKTLTAQGGTSNRDTIVRKMDSFIKDELQKQGYDGVVYKGTGDYQVFDTAKKDIFYSGSKGNVVKSPLDLTNKKVITIQGDQKTLTNSKSYVEADQKLHDQYSKDYDFIKIEHPELPQKGDEYYNLAEKKWYSQDPVVAESYAIQNRGGKYELNPEDKSLFNQLEKTIDNTPPFENSISDEASKIQEEAQALRPDIASTIEPLEAVVGGDRNTPINERIRWIDYLRTPWRVFDRMGIRPYYQELLEGYENYIQELPGNIDKITEWSKQVGKESNERIFRFLDGEAIQLDQNEARVAGEIKDWLSNWADRLGMSKDARISEYITHIFPIKKGGEIPEEIAHLIRKKIPGSVYNPFLLQRQGAEGYRKDTWAALDAYTKRATRKVNMDPGLNALKEASAKLTDTSQLNYLTNYVSRVNLRPSELDTSIDNHIKEKVGYLFGARPTASISRMMRKMIARAKIGGSATSFAKNLTQGVNTFSELGTKYTIIGYNDLVKFGGKELQDNGVLIAPFIEDRTYSAVKKAAEKFDNALFINMNSSELVNRGAAYYGAKQKFIDGKISPKEYKKALGKEMPANYTPTLEDAVNYGKAIASETQFLFGPLDTPVALSSDLAKMAFQFQTFGLKQAEFVGQMVGNKEWVKLIRYMLSSMLLFNFIGGAFGMKWDDSFKTLRWGMPPAIQFLIDLWQAGVTGKDKYGNVLDNKQRAKAVGKSLFTNVVPMGSQINKSVEGFKTVNQGKGTSPSGKFQYKVEKTPFNYVRGTLFGKYNLPESKAYYKKQDEKAKAAAKKRSKSGSSSNRYNPI